MTPRRAVVSVLVSMTVALAGCGDKKSSSAPVEPAIVDPTAEALAYAPDRAAVLAILQTDTATGPGAALEELFGRLPGGDEVRAGVLAVVGDGLGLDAERDLLPLAGRPLVAWSPDAQGLPSAAWVTSDAATLSSLIGGRVQSGDLQDGGLHRGFALFTRSGGAYATQGAVLLSGPSIEALKATIDLREGRRGGWSPRLVRERSAGLPRGALLTLLASGPAVLDRVDPALRAKVPALAAAGRVALGVVPARDGVRVRLRAALDPETLTSTDLPIAAGAKAPVVRGTGEVVVAVRDLAQVLAFTRRTLTALDPGRLERLDDALELLARFARVDVEGDVLARLTGDATLVSDDGRTATLRAETDDGDAVEDALDRLGRLARLGGPLAGLAGVDLDGLGVRDDGDGRQTITQDDEPLLSLLVQDDALVAATDAGADLSLAADAPPEKALPARGALHVRVSDDVLEDQLLDRLGLPPIARLALEPLGDPILTARAEPELLDAELFLPVD